MIEEELVYKRPGCALLKHPLHVPPVGVVDVDCRGRKGQCADEADGACACGWPAYRCASRFSPYRWCRIEQAG
jgi:hypothetical protein